MRGPLAELLLGTGQSPGASSARLDKLKHVLPEHFPQLRGHPIHSVARPNVRRGALPDRRGHLRHPRHQRHMFAQGIPLRRSRRDAGTIDPVAGASAALAGQCRRAGWHRRQAAGSSAIPSFRLREEFAKQPAADQQFREPLHQRQQPMLRHVRDQFVEHAPLAEQRVCARL